MKKLKLFLLTTLSFLFILSCEIGLGASVDTDPPQLTINNPPVDSVIRNTFAISGEYSDDGTIESVTATLQKIDDGSTFELTGNFTQNEIKRLSGTWSIEVNPKTSDGGVAISDGAYQATIFIKDTSGRITKQNTTFTIDNTPPVLILTKPSSKPGDETLSVYGQRLFLEGSIADTTKETYIEASFYADEACTQLLDTVKTDAIAPTDVNSNNAKIATFLDAHYDKIYGNSKNGNLKLYAKLKVYDSAISIPLNGVQTAEDKKGNSTSTYYVSKDLAKKISLSKTSGGYGLAPIDLYHILSGKEKNNDNGRSAADRANIINELNSIKTQKSYFSLNPDNSPYFTVSGLKTLTKSGHDFDDSENGYYLKNGTITLEVSVFMGNDSIELVDDEDFYVYLQRCDEIGNATINNQTIAPKIPLYSKYGERIEGALKKYLYKVGGKEGHKTTTGAYVFSIPMNKILETNTDEGVVNLNLSYNETYLIGVNGCDNERNPVVAYDNGYGFKFVASGTGPIVIVENEMYVTTNTTNITEEAIKSPLKVTVSVDTTESELTIKRAPDNDPINPPAEEEAVYIKDENGLDITSITIPGSQTSINAYDYYQIPANAEYG